MTKHTALYAGTFDPFTNGHLDIVQRALKLFEKVTLLVAVSPSKKPLLPVEKRVELLKELFSNEPRVSVDSWNGLLVDYAAKHGIGHLVRGLRPTGDFEGEFQMASMNRKLQPNLDTVFLATSEHAYYLSSSLVKEVLSHGGDVSPFVPAIFLAALKKAKG